MKGGEKYKRLQRKRAKVDDDFIHHFDAPFKHFNNN